MKYLVYITAIFLLSCNPVKKVLKDSEKFEQVAQEVVRRGYCINDTTRVTTVKDTVYIYTTTISDTIFVGADCEIDTVLPSGTWIRVEDGYLTISEIVNYKTREVIKTVDNYIRDTKYEDLLKKDILDRDSKITQQHGTLVAYKEQVDKLNRSLNKFKWFLGICLGAILAAVGLRIYMKTIKPF